MALVLRSLWLVVVVSALIGCGNQQAASVKDESLVLDIPELCSKCLEVLRCQNETQETIYVLHEKSVGAQIATIWDYMVQHLRPKTEDFRDASMIVRERRGSQWGPIKRTDNLRARLDVSARRVELAGAQIEQRDGSWRDSSGKLLGRCGQLRNLEASKFLRELR